MLDRKIMVLIPVALFILLAATIGSLKEETSNTTKLAKNAEPAVVLVQATFAADIEVATPYLDKTKLNYTLNKIIEQVMQGFIPAEESAMWRVLADEMRAKPLDFLQKSGQKKVIHNGYRAVASGFLVTPDGYLVTDAQVVSPDEKLLKQQLSAPILEEAVTLLMGEIAAKAAGIPADTRDYVLKAIADMVVTYYVENIKVKNLQQTYDIGMGVQIPGVHLFQKGLRAEVVQMGVSPKDVAILKMKGHNNLPTVSMGDATDLTPGSKIFVLGYSGVATFHPLYAEINQTQPNLTAGVISAQKTKEGGWGIFQTNADLTSGISGGPVFNEQGEVVGLATFDSQGLNAGQFVVPILVIKECLEKANVKPTEGLVTKTYREAIDLYYQQHYKKALIKFQEVATLYPGHAYVQDFIAASQKAINEGKDKSIPGWVLIGIPVATIMLVMVVVVIIYQREKAPPATADTPVEAAVSVEQKDQENKVRDTE